MRKVFGPVAVSVIIGAIALVFVFYGVYNPQGGGSSSSVAATVDGDHISLQEYNREYQQRVDFYQNMMQGKGDPEMFRQMGLGRQVLEDLIRRKLLLQEAERLGLTVSDEEVRGQITEMPYFKNKEGRFDPGLYQNILQANQYSPTAFEDSVREDLLRQHAVEFIRERAKVSEPELEKEFLANEDRRQLEYVLVSREDAKGLIKISDKEIDEFLKSEAGLKAARDFYEQRKMAYLKPQKPQPKKDPKAKEAKPQAPEFYSFDEVKRKVTAELLKDRRSEEITKLSRDLANEVFAKAKAAPGELAGFARAKGLELKTSERFNRLQPVIPVAGSVPALASDAFADNSPLAKEPKLYDLPTGGYVIARGLKAFPANMANFAKEKQKLATEVTQRKEQVMLEQWMEQLRSKAKVSMNEAIVNPGQGEE